MYLIYIKDQYHHQIINQSYHNNSQMKSSKLQAFLTSIKDDIAAVKLLKYRYLIQNYPKQASEIRDQMLSIALDNKLIGQYKLIHQMYKISQAPNPIYHKLRESLISQTSQLHSQQKIYKAQQNYQKHAQTLLKLGQIYFSYGQYKQCTTYYNNISIINSHLHRTRFEQYATQYALSYYYLNQYYSLSRFNTRFMQKDVLKQLPDLCIIKDINNIDYRRNMDKPFRNTMEMEISNIQLTKNRVMSYGDLGFYFSLLSIAYKKKSQVKFVKWSYKLENQFINNQYKSILETLESQRQTRCFLPAINKVYEQCQSLFKKRIILQIVSAYDRCPFKIIQQMTGINQGQIRLFVKNNTDLPLLFDPITSSVVLKRTNVPLYKQVNRLYNTLLARYNEEMAMLLRKEDDDGDMGELMGGISRHRSGDRHGGMGGLGGMGRMGGGGTFGRMGGGRHGY